MFGLEHVLQLTVLSLGCESRSHKYSRAVDSLNICTCTLAFITGTLIKLNNKVVETSFKKSKLFRQK